MKKILTENFSKILLLSGIAILFLGIGLFLWQDYSINLSDKIQSDKVAQFGDFVGGLVGSIWSLAGVVLFYVALKEQRNDFAVNRDVFKAQTKALEQQIKEFELQREELHETRKVFILQNETLNFQRFESTFFNLLELHHKIIKEINSGKYTAVEIKPSRSETKDGKLHGYPSEWTSIVGQGKEFIKSMSKLYSDTIKSKEVSDYNKFFKQIQDNGYNGLDLYFRNLHSLFKFIDDAEISSDQSNNIELREKYFHILINQMSEFELILIYNFEDAKINFRYFFNKYKVVVNINHQNNIY